MQVYALIDPSNVLLLQIRIHFEYFESACVPALTESIFLNRAFFQHFFKLSLSFLLPILYMLRNSRHELRIFTRHKIGYIEISAKSELSSRKPGWR